MSGVPKLLLDFQELADAVGVHLATVYRLRDRGELPIPVLHIGRCSRVRTVDVESWLAELAEADKLLGTRRRTPAGQGNGRAGVAVSVTAGLRRSARGES